MMETVADIDRWTFMAESDFIYNYITEWFILRYRSTSWEKGEKSAK